MDICKEIKSKVNTIDYISKYTDLTDHGNYYSGLCPFHSEQNPSFRVKGDNWECYAGCGKGSVIDFKMKIDNCSLQESISFFAKSLGIQSLDTDDYIKKDPFLESMNKLNEKEFQPVILNEEVINDYTKVQHKLISDRFSEDVIETFKIGFCTDPYNYNFYNRITFPVYNNQNKLVGIIGRKVTIDDEPKYKYSVGFNKSMFLYGLNITMKYIKEKKEMIICEGAKDALALYNAGIRNVVATMGCRPSDSQLKIINRYSHHNIICAYDDDEAGENGYRVLNERFKIFGSVKRMGFNGAKDPEQLTDNKIIECYNQINIK